MRAPQKGLIEGGDGRWRMVTRNLVVVCGIISAFVIILVPYIHLGFIYSFWKSKKVPVKKSSCTCSCWDTLFKGSYESGISGYKHIYFNITPQTFKIWVLTGICLIVFYETLKHVFHLVLRRKVRWSMLTLFASVIYPHYYGWWMYFNAWNDDFYKQWYHQGFFSLTELVSTVLVIYQCNKSRDIQPRLMVAIISIAILHILASGGDQFVANVFLKEGKWHQYARDVGFMIPDLMHIVIPVFDMVSFLRRYRLKWWEVIKYWDLLGSLGFIFSMWYFIRHL